VKRLSIRAFVAASLFFCVQQPLFAQMRTGRIEVLETSACSGGVASRAVICADSTAHTLKLSNNNGSFLNVLLSAGLITVASGKTLTVNNTLTLAGTDSTTMTFPGTSASVARTDAAQTFTGDQTFAGKILGTDNSTSTTVGDTTHRFITYASRQITGASTPTASSTGTGASPTNTVDTGSGDLAGTITVTAGTTPSASGTVTVTFSTGNGAYGTNAPSCVAMLGNGTGTWNARATLIAGAFSTTSAVFNWDNNAVNLTAASTYKLHYHCAGK
jgi:hypothetical protein